MGCRGDITPFQGTTVTGLGLAQEPARERLVLGPGPFTSQHSVPNLTPPPLSPLSLPFRP